MSGPSVNRLNNAGQPSLTQPGLNLLGSIFGQPGGGVSGSPLQQMPRTGGNMPRTTPLGAGGGMAGMNLSRLGAMGQPQAPQPSIGPGLGGNYLQNLQQAFGFQTPPQMAALQQLGATNPGQNVVNAYQPIFQRNLSLAEDQGPRFSSGNDLLRTQALNDYNLFANQALQQGQQQQLQALLGGGQLGLQAQGQQLGVLQQLLGTLFQGGGLNSGPIYNVQPGFGSQIAGLLGTVGGAALGNPAIGGAIGSMFGGGGGGGGMGGPQDLMSSLNNAYGGLGMQPDPTSLFGQQWKPY